MPVDSDDGGIDGGAGGCSASCARTLCIGARNCHSSGPTYDPRLAPCPQLEVCPRAVFVRRLADGGASKVEANATDTEANARCALEALRDGKVGHVSATTLIESVRRDRDASVEVDPDRGEDAIVDVVAGRRAFAVLHFAGEEGLGDWSTSVPVNVPLKPASYFADCLATNDLEAFEKCLSEPVESSCP
jgi:hypothetical protein